MGILAELAEVRAITEAEVGAAPRSRERWATICVCGHEDVMHGVGNGGSFGVGQPGRMTVDGCRGAIPGRDEGLAREVDASNTVHYLPTCPCMKVRPIVKFDRPGRLFRQKVYTLDSVHPFDRGLRAILTRLENSKEFGPDAEAELERRLQWVDGARVCAICTGTDAVAPVYVNVGRNSEMRCKRHYAEPYGAR